LVEGGHDVIDLIPNPFVQVTVPAVFFGHGSLAMVDAKAWPGAGAATGSGYVPFGRPTAPALLESAGKQI
jgi:hypothetical protein